MVKIYKMEYFYTIGPQGQYEEVFNLGCYESEEYALREQLHFFRKLPGFRQGTSKNFRIIPYTLDCEFWDQKAGAAIPSVFYELSHGYDIDCTYTIGTVIGYYSKIEFALEMKQRHEKWPILKSITGKI